MSKQSEIEDILEGLNADLWRARRRYDGEVRGISDEIAKVQKECDHHWVKPCAEADYHCKLCGVFE